MERKKLLITVTGRLMSRRKKIERKTANERRRNEKERNKQEQSWMLLSHPGRAAFRTGLFPLFWFGWRRGETRCSLLMGQRQDACWGACVLFFSVLCYIRDGRIVYSIKC